MAIPPVISALTKKYSKLLGEFEFAERQVGDAFGLKATIAATERTAWASLGDYRAKNLIGPYQDVGNIVDVVRVYEDQYTIHGMPDGPRAMFLAHEIQEKVSYAVDGEKDGRELQVLSSTDPLASIF